MPFTSKELDEIADKAFDWWLASIDAGANALRFWQEDVDDVDFDYLVDLIQTGAPTKNR